MNEHTPGPWRVLERNAYGDILVGIDALPLAIVGHGMTANARLIAAAPELLMWLEFALRRLKDSEGGLSDHANDEITRVIAKAKGRPRGPRSAGVSEHSEYETPMNTTDLEQIAAARNAANARAWTEPTVSNELAAAKAQLRLHRAYMQMVMEHQGEDWEGRICTDRLPDGGYLQDLITSLEDALARLVKAVSADLSDTTPVEDENGITWRVPKA